MASALRIRPVSPDDLIQLQAVAEQLDTVNLPSNEQALQQIISDSVRSFSELAEAADTHPHSHHQSYTFVAVENGTESGTESGTKVDHLVGTATCFAYHGLPDDPHYYLRVAEQTVHSHQLGIDRLRTVLKLGHDTEPWTELGGLIVRAEARGRGVGKALLGARLLLMAMHPQHFCRRVIAELLPPQRPDGGNAFWDAVGKPLTGLEYYRADLLCRTDKEFIKAFFPHDELVAELLPPEARALIGTEGPDTTPIRRLLRRAGFSWLGTVDPFDAGPHDGATLDEIIPIQRSRRCVRLESPPSAGVAHLLAGAGHQLTMTTIEHVGEGVRIDPAVADQLDIRIGDACWTMALDW